MKKRLMVLLVTVLVLLLVGCTQAEDKDEEKQKNEQKQEIVEEHVKEKEQNSGIAEEETILQDLKSSVQSSEFEISGEIKDVGVVTRYTDETHGYDIIMCSLTVGDGVATSQERVLLVYNSTENKDWILDDVITSNSKEWGKIPLSGVSDIEITGYLYENNSMWIETDSGMWDVLYESIVDFSIIERDTNLLEKKDTVIVELTLDSPVAQTTGQVLVEYVYENGWQPISAIPNSEFITSFKTENALNITKDDLIEVLSTYELSYCMQDAYEQSIIVNDASYYQYMKIDKTNILDFTIDSHEITAKGVLQKFHCSGTLLKSGVTLGIEADFEYHYNDSEWKVEGVDAELEVLSMDILGQWVGAYNGTPYGGSVSLNISEMGENGIISGIYSYTPYELNDYSQAGSYYVSGLLDTKELRLKLTAGEWIEEPVWKLSITKQDIDCTLYIEDGKLQGRGHEGNIFEAWK